MWRMPRIELNGEGEPVWLTPHLRDPQPEGEREDVAVHGAAKVSAHHSEGLLFRRVRHSEGLSPQKPDYQTH